MSPAAWAQTRANDVPSLFLTQVGMTVALALGSCENMGGSLESPMNSKGQGKYRDVGDLSASLRPTYLSLSQKAGLARPGAVRMEAAESLWWTDTCPQQGGPGEKLKWRERERKAESAKNQAQAWVKAGGHHWQVPGH